MLTLLSYATTGFGTSNCFASSFSMECSYTTVVLRAALKARTILYAIPSIGIAFCPRQIPAQDPIGVVMMATLRLMSDNVRIIGPLPLG